MDLFRRIAVPWIFDAEGGYVADKVDRGGTTHYGISLRYLRQVPDGDIDRDGDIDDDDVRLLTREQAIAYYQRDYWTANGCDLFPPVIALACFDSAVHHGGPEARRMIQRGLHVEADAMFGPDTLKAAEKADPIVFLVDYCGHRAAYLSAIIRRDQQQARFEIGWFRRLFKLFDYARREV